MYVYIYIYIYIYVYIYTYIYIYIHKGTWLRDLDKLEMKIQEEKL